VASHFTAELASDLDTVLGIHTQLGVGAADDQRSGNTDRFVRGVRDAAQRVLALELAPADGAS